MGHYDMLFCICYCLWYVITHLLIMYHLLVSHMQQVFHPVGTPLSTMVNLASVSTSSSFQRTLPLSCKSDTDTHVSVVKFEALMNEAGEGGTQEAATNLQGDSLDSKMLTVRTDSDVKHNDQSKEVTVKFEPHNSSVLSMKVQHKV